MLSKFRYHLKLCRVVVHILRGCFICWLFFPWLNKAAKRHYVQRWSQQVLAIFNVRLKTNLTSMALNTVVISNHISWLDIFVINSLAPCRFVAKAEIGSWPLLGWLAKRAGTIYIARGRKADVKRIYPYLIEKIIAGERVAFFPEGMVAVPGQLLLFHANLFEAAIRAKAPIQPMTLRYLNSAGELHPAVDYSGDITFPTSMKNVLNAADEIIVELNGLECIPCEGLHRRELATVSRKAIAAALRINIE